MNEFQTEIYDALINCCKCNKSPSITFAMRCDGLSSTEIEKIRGISQETVKHHISKITSQMGCASIYEAMYKVGKCVG